MAQFFLRTNQALPLGKDEAMLLAINSSLSYVATMINKL